MKKYYFTKYWHPFMVIVHHICTDNLVYFITLFTKSSQKTTKVNSKLMSISFSTLLPLSAFKQMHVFIPCIKNLEPV